MGHGNSNGSEGEGPDAWWRTIGSNPRARRVWMVACGVLSAVFVAVWLRGGGDGQEGGIQGGMHGEEGRVS